MSTFLIGLLLSLGGSAWVYSKIQRTTGGNTQTSLIIAAAAFAVLFVFTFVVASFLPE